MQSALKIKGTEVNFIRRTIYYVLVLSRGLNSLVLLQELEDINSVLT